MSLRWVLVGVLASACTVRTVGGDGDKTIGPEDDIVHDDSWRVHREGNRAWLESDVGDIELEWRAEARCLRVRTGGHEVELPALSTEDPDWAGALVLDLSSLENSVGLAEAVEPLAQSFQRAVETHEVRGPLLASADAAETDCWTEAWNRTLSRYRGLLDELSVAGLGRSAGVIATTALVAAAGWWLAGPIGVAAFAIGWQGTIVGGGTAFGALDCATRNHAFDEAMH